MKKIVIIISIIVVCLVSLKEDNVIIPSNAIRFRIIANSNSLEDQKNKIIIESKLTEYIESIVKDKDKQEVKKVLLNNKKNIDNQIDSIIDKYDIKTSYNVSIGNNYFPNKIYHGIKYDAGYYDSVVVTLGKGNGINWWCVMYPPLCLIDDNKTDYEYTTIVKEILDKYNM